MSSTAHERAVWERFWDRKREVAEVYSTSGRTVDALRTLSDVRGRKVLEVGAGTGRDSLELAEAGAQVIVLDYAENALRIVRELFSEEQQRVHMVRANALELPFKEDVLDIVFHQGLLEHFRDPEPLLKENYRVLRSGGHVLVDVPQKFHIYTVIKHVLIGLNIWFAGWETEFSINELRRLLQRVGFRVLRSYGDWMRPSLFYRILREGLYTVGISLPLYPLGPVLLRRIRSDIRNWIGRSHLALYTYLDIGVIGSKE